MFWKRQQGRVVTANQYVTQADFCRVFENEMARFYLLALMLTGKPHLAEECFARALEECLQSPRVFKQWSERWAVHCIVKVAIRMTRPVVSKTTHSGPAVLLNPASDRHQFIHAITQFAPLDRFVFVMTVLEQYSDRECATFLGCRVAEVEPARTRARRQLAAEPSLIREEWKARASA